MNIKKTLYKLKSFTLKCCFWFVELINKLCVFFSSAEKEKQLDAFRCCCALVLKGNNNKMGDNEKAILWSIGKGRGVNSKHIADIIAKLEKKHDCSYKQESRLAFESYKTDVLKGLSEAEKEMVVRLLAKISKSIDGIADMGESKKGESKCISKTNRKKIERIVRMLYDIAYIIHADGKVSEEENLFFDFVCIKMGILDINGRRWLKTIMFGYISRIVNSLKGDLGDGLGLLRKQCDVLVDFIMSNNHILECFDVEYVDLKMLGNRSNYLKAVIRIEERNNDDKELYKVQQTGLMRDMEFENYWNMVFRYNVTSYSFKANLIFDLFNIIWADEKVNINEELLFKICSVIYNVKRDDYHSLLSELQAFYVEHDDWDIIDRIKNRYRTVGRIKRILSRNESFLVDKKARFGLVCSMAFVDGDLGGKEEVELYHIGMRDYSLKREQISEIIEVLKKNGRQNLSGSWKQFVKDFLVNIPDCKKERLKDLSNCLTIIYSDDNITDAERSAFEIVCLFYGVNKDFFFSSAYNTSVSNGKGIEKKYLTEIDDYGKIRLKREGYNKIETVFEAKLIHGPFFDSVKYALNKRYNEILRNSIRRDRNATKFAFIVFVISAFFLLFKINTIAHDSFKNSIKQTKFMALKEHVWAIDDVQKANVLLGDTIGEGLLAVLCRSSLAVYDSIGTRTHEEEYKPVIEQKTENATCDTINHYYDNVRNFINKTHGNICGFFDIVKEIRNKIRDNIPSPLIEIIVIISYICWIIRPIRRKISRFYSHNKMYLLFWFLIIMLVLSNELFTFVLLLAAMLSIEWLILMREKEYSKSEKQHSKCESVTNAPPAPKSHSSLLVVLVVMAIMADISFGMVELQQIYTLSNVMDKIFSALFLGCICFFMGKFMDMQYVHESEDKEYMNEVLNKLDKWNNEEKEVVEEYSKR